MVTLLPSIPAKRYFTIGEVAELCGVKPHVLRYWEQEFTQLRPMKRRGNRRYYQHHEVLMIRRIRDLLYDQGFTISGARNKLQEMAHVVREAGDAVVPQPTPWAEMECAGNASSGPAQVPLQSLDAVRQELLEIRTLLLSGG
jgi:DNA-binding transcriptional MerR regulator